MAATARRGLLFILSSPSGAGKSTISRRLLAANGDMSFSVSATTRAPREGEVDGREYFFRSRAEFNAMVEAGEMLEHAEVFGNFYGSPLAPVEAAISSGRDVVFDIDWQGGKQVRASTLAADAVSVFILPPSIGELERRLKGRAADSDEVIAARMAKSMDEISHWREYDYVLVNDDLDICARAVEDILKAERLRRARQPGLEDFVAGLEREFGEMSG